MGKRRLPSSTPASRASSNRSPTKGRLPSSTPVPRASSAHGSRRSSPGRTAGTFCISLCFFVFFCLIFLSFFVFVVLCSCTARSLPEPFLFPHHIVHATCKEGSS